jgi:hypothetical protein
LKNSLTSIWQKLLRVRKLYKRFSQSPRHFLSPDFRLFSGKPTFSTATPVLNTYLEAGVRFTQNA